MPKQHNSEKDNEPLKQGKIPQDWQDKPQRGAQNDTDARWTKKGNKSYFAYKDPIGIDAEYGLIRCYEVTDASLHDSQVLGQLLDEDNESDEIWADSAYRSQEVEEVLKLMGFDSHIHERAYRNQPLSEEQKQSNRDKSKTRAKVEQDRSLGRGNRCSPFTANRSSGRALRWRPNASEAFPP